MRSVPFVARRINATTALESNPPLRNAPNGTSLTMEYIALANHRKTLRAEIARYAELFRTEQVKTITAAMERYAVDFEEFTPTVLMVLLTGATQALVQEELLGMRVGHDETLRFAEKWLTFLEGPRQLDPDWRRG